MESVKEIIHMSNQKNRNSRKRHHWIHHFRLLPFPLFSTKMISFNFHQFQFHTLFESNYLIIFKIQKTELIIGLLIPSSFEHGFFCPNTLWKWIISVFRSICSFTFFSFGFVFFLFFGIFSFLLTDHWVILRLSSA